jgi:hypothetical protein
MLLQKIRRLPPQRRAEVEDFVDFLQARERAQAAARLGVAFEQLDTLDEPAMTPEEIQAEIQTARAERRARADRD